MTDARSARGAGLATVAGDRVSLNPGARVGSEGFGFATDSRGDHVTVPQLGVVRLGDGVEIGANACVDRGSGNDTELGPGTRLDNLLLRRAGSPGRSSSAATAAMLAARHALHRPVREVARPTLRIA